MQITCSTVARLLDLISSQEGSLIGSSGGKKKKKAIKHQSDDLYNDLVFKGKDIVSFLSSLLDVLLLKKDLDDRSVSVLHN